MSTDRYLAYLPRIAALWAADAPEETWRSVEGTLVFADVSGFTPLTEKLARRGKVGAEELTDVLNRVFTQLLDTAALYGGDLLKFGGDALLLLFTGDGHSERAATACHALLAALRPFRRFRTPGGVVSLSMSIGMESGPVDLFLVGGTSRELLVAGDVATCTVLMEHAAASGEILAGPRACAALHAHVVGEAHDGGRQIIRSPGAATRPLPDVDVPAGVTDTLVPAALREHLSRPTEFGEHRLAGLSFLQFSGVDRLLRTSGPHAVADALGAVISAAEDACEQFGVTFLATDVDSDGGKILFVAGAPAATPDDADRLLHALIPSVRTDVPVSLRAGANLGRAFAVDVGSPTRRTYAVMGDATNLAARVMGRARNRQVVATEALLQHTRERFRLRRLEPFMVKGKSMPVHAAVVGPPAGAQRRRTRPTELPFIGRRDELLRLQRALDRARDGTGSRFRLVGEPGLGKSTLLRQVATRAAKFTRVVVEGNQYAVDSPYFCLRAPLRALVDVSLHASEDHVAAALLRVVRTVAPDLEPWLPMLAVAWGCGLPDNDVTAEVAPEHRRQRQHAVVSELLHCMLTRETLLVVEDAHWVDEASADLLAALTAGAGERPWCVIATRRPVAGGFATDDEGWTDIRLHSLGEDEISGALAGAVSSLPPYVRTELARRSGGNPLFLHELVAAVARGDEVATLPTSVEAMVAAGIDELPHVDREVLRIASVLGARFRPQVLSDMLVADGRGPLAVDRLPRHLHLDADGLVRFEHALMRDVAYESLPYRQRRLLHGHAGRVLEETHRASIDDVIELLSMHFHLACDYARSWEYARVAGERALTSMAAAEAAVHLQRALEAGTQLRRPAEETAAIAERLGDALEVCGQYDDAAAAIGSASRSTDDPLTRARLLRKQGRIRERASRYSDALRWYTRAEKALVELGPRREAESIRAQLRMSYAAARLAQGRYRDAVPLLKEAVAQAERLEDHETLAHAYYLLDWALTDLGSEERHRYRDLALPIYEETGNLVGQGFALNNLGIDAYWEGRWDDALACYLRVREVCARSGDVVTDATVLNNVGEILSDRGLLDEAERCFRDALAMMSAGRRFPVGVAIVTSNLGRLANRRGDFDAAREHLADARARFLAIGSDALRCETDAREAERLLLAGQADRAREVAAEAEQQAQRIAGLRVVVVQLQRTVALADAAAGDLDVAQAGLAAAAADAATAQAAYEAGITRYAEAAVLRALGDTATAEATLIAAAAVLDGLGIVHVEPSLQQFLGHLQARRRVVRIPAQRAADAPVPTRVNR